MSEKPLDEETEKAILEAHPCSNLHGCPTAKRFLTLARRVQAIERERAVSLAEAHKHVGPFDGKDNLDRIAAYSNSTVDLIVRAIRSTGESA